MDQAYFLRDKIMTGKWNSVTFIDVDINLAEKSPIPAAPTLLESIVGVYEFDPADFPQVQRGHRIQFNCIFRSNKVSWKPNGPAETEIKRIYMHLQKKLFLA